jgi:hypothetical protein
MGYSYEEFFQQHIEPEMKKLFLEKAPVVDPETPLDDRLYEPDISDRFMDIIRAALVRHEGQRFIGQFLRLLIDPNREGLSPERFVRDCLTHYNDEVEPLGLSYRLDNIKVTADYTFEDGE